MAKRKRPRRHRYGDHPTDLARRGDCGAARRALEQLPAGIRRDYAADRVEELCAVMTPRTIDLDRPRNFYGLAPRAGRLTQRAIVEAHRRAQLVDRDQDFLYRDAFRRQSGLENEDLLRKLRKRRHNFGALPPIRGRKCPVREGTRVVFNPNPVSRLLYSRGTPRAGEHGTVTTIPGFRGRSTCMAGPGGGLIYVDWDEFGTMGIAPGDLDKER